jgi:PAB1-binding protein PBP1
MGNEDNKSEKLTDHQKPELTDDDLVMDTDGKMVIPMEKRWSTDNFLDGAKRVPTTLKKQSSDESKT